MAGQSFQLVVRAGPNPGKVYPIMKKEIIIGRDPNSDVLINDAEISRHHASIKFQPEGFVIEDLGSTNGTVINGQKLAGPHYLHPGEIINLGEHISLVFDRQISFDPDATMVSPANSFPPAPIKVQPPSFAEPEQKPYIPPGEQEPAEPTKSPPKLLLILILAAILLIICVCIGVLWYIDSNFLWCKVMPFLPACQLP